MEKIKQFCKEHISALVLLSAAVLSFIFFFTMSGVKITQVVEGIEIVGTVPLSGVAFGSSRANFQFSYSGSSIDVGVPFSGGLSVFGLISFILLFVSMALIIYAMVKENAQIELYGAICLLVSGICMFLVLVAGSDVVADLSGFGQEKIAESFREFYEDTHISVGVYFYGIVCILGGVFGIYRYFKGQNN